ncbi:MAG: plasmid replication initiator TrfA [Myxococcota bacterium]
MLVGEKKAEAKSLVAQAFIPTAKDNRPAPSEILRSALFGVSSKKRSRAQLTNHPIFTCGDTQVTYTGEQLDQGDLDLYMAALKMVWGQGYKASDSSYEFVCTVHDFQKLLNLSKCGTSGERIKESFTRMTSCSLTIKSKGMNYCGTLIVGFVLDTANGTYKLEFNSKMAALFRHGCTYINWNVRRMIKGELARRVQALVLSHKASGNQPQSYKTATLKKLCCSGDSNERRFKANVRKTMGMLQLYGDVKDWSFRGDILRYTRN